MTPAERFAAALSEVEAALDWPALGRLYCHEGGGDFFTPADREALSDAGLRIAAELAEALERVRAGRPDAPRRSLYVGAALAELAPILCEALVLEREVVAVNVACEEVTHLNRALAEVAARLDLPLPSIRTEPLAAVARGAFDHLWLVSVLNDPTAFPALHDELYGRRGTELATGRGDPAAERRAAERLVADALAGLDPPALLTTTDEELPLVAPACRARGLELDVPARGVLSAIVGDPLRFCALSRATGTS